MSVPAFRPEKMIRGLDGRPQPPVDVLARLQAYDPRIGLFYTKASWAITEKWRETDPRREWIQRGEMSPDMAFDVCGYLPMDCSLDDALAYVERELRSYTAEQFTALRHAVTEHNTRRQDAVMESAILGAVSNDLDAANIVSPGISEAVGIELVPDPPKPKNNMSKAREALAAKVAARKAAKANEGTAS